MHYSAKVNWPDKGQKNKPLNWDSMAEDVAVLTYRLTSQNELECAITFPFVVNLHFDDRVRTFGPNTKRLLTTAPNAAMVRDILDDMRKPYVIFNDHLTN